MILCCGEALIDMIPAPSRAGGEVFVPHTGGAVFNTAIALGRLDVPAGMIAGLSNDMFGQQLEAELHRSGVSTQHLIRSNRPTTLAFVKLSEGQADYAFFDENSAGRMVAKSDLPILDPSCQALFFGGISLVCEPGAGAYLSLAEREAPRHVVMLDPNIRPNFITDEDRYRARLDRMLRCADIVKTSDEDLAWLSGSDALDPTAKALQRKYNCVLIVTQGSKGAAAYLPNGEVLQIPAVEAEVADTVGAGDTFNAGVLGSLHKQGLLSKPQISRLSAEAIEKALHFAAEVAALTVSKPGANPPFDHELSQGRERLL